jgi:Uma2 family endonuclease
MPAARDGKRLMSTIARSRRPKLRTRVHRASPIAGERRIVIRGVPWEIYDRLSDAVGEGQHVWLTYDGKDLEIMTTGNIHEYFKDFLGQFVSEVATELRIPHNPAGETTWKRPELERGLEADQCYYFTPEKRAVVVAAVKRRSNNVADYPNPDLAIEIDISPPEVDRPGIYAVLRVPEIWRFDGDNVAIEQLQEDGTYVRVEMSQFLPVRAEEIRRWIVEEDLSDKSAWSRRLRTWARRLARRLHPRPRRAKGSDRSRSN